MSTKKNQASQISGNEGKVRPTKKGKRAVTNASAPAPVAADDVEIKGKPIALPSEPGAKKLTESKTPAQLKKDIDELLDLLRSSTSKNEKKRIRRALRTRGHRGGLNGEKSAIQIARAKAANAADPDDDDEDEDDDD